VILLQPYMEKLLQMLYCSYVQKGVFTGCIMAYTKGCLSVHCLNIYRFASLGGLL
jgi:hypothetical protein